MERRLESVKHLSAVALSGVDYFLAFFITPVFAGVTTLRLFEEDRPFLYKVGIIGSVIVSWHTCRNIRKRVTDDLFKYGRNGLG